MADSETIAKAREAMRKKMEELGTTPQPGEVAPATQPIQVSYTPKTAKAAATTAMLPPIQGPALPISADKQQRLNALLQKYRNDQITPDQYQSERAKILAE